MKSRTLSLALRHAPLASMVLTRAQRAAAAAGGAIKRTSGGFMTTAADPFGGETFEGAHAGRRRTVRCLPFWAPRGGGRGRAQWWLRGSNVLYRGKMWGAMRGLGAGRGHARREGMRLASQHMKRKKRTLGDARRCAPPFPPPLVERDP